MKGKVGQIDWYVCGDCKHYYDYSITMGLKEMREWERENKKSGNGCKAFGSWPSLGQLEFNGDTIECPKFEEGPIESSPQGRKDEGDKPDSPRSMSAPPHPSNKGRVNNNE